jgi:hypothetical protein
MLLDAMNPAVGLDMDITWELIREEGDGPPDEQHGA